jgi:pimeloyl-ACP methyl ester carboxylesterase
MRDRIEGRNVIQAMRQRNPAIRVRVLEEIGHCPNLEASAILVEELIALLDLGPRSQQPLNH